MVQTFDTITAKCAVFCQFYIFLPYELTIFTIAWSSKKSHIITVWELTAQFSLYSDMLWSEMLDSDLEGLDLLLQSLKRQYSKTGLLQGRSGTQWLSLDHIRGITLPQRFHSLVRAQIVRSTNRVRQLFLACSLSHIRNNIIFQASLALGFLDKLTNRFLRCLLITYGSLATFYWLFAFQYHLGHYFWQETF